MRNVEDEDEEYDEEEERDQMFNSNQDDGRTQKAKVADEGITDSDLQIHLQETNRLIEDRAKDIARLSSKMMT